MGLKISELLEASELTGEDLLEIVQDGANKKLSAAALMALFARSDHDHDAADIVSGVLDAGRIPTLSASRITSGTFGSSRIPPLPASKIASGRLSTARLGGGSATTSTFLRGDGTWATPPSGGGSGGDVSFTVGSTSSEVTGFMAVCANVGGLRIFNLFARTTAATLLHVDFAGVSSALAHDYAVHPSATLVAPNGRVSLGFTQVSVFSGGMTLTLSGEGPTTSIPADTRISLCFTLAA